MAAACGAKNRSGGRCKKPGTGVGGRCRLHGGASLVGPAAPAFKHGRHSKHLPANLLERYQTAVSDTELITLRDEVALLDVRIGQLLEAVGETGNLRLWKEARSKMDALKSVGAKKKAEVGTARAALQALDDLIDTGLAAAATWEELRELLDLRRRTVDSETKRMKDLHQTITVERALVIMAMLVNEVRKHVQDRTTLAAITSEFLRLTGQRSGEAAPAVLPRS